MSIFDDLIKFNDDGNVEYVGWVEWKHISMGLIHCPVCLILDKCWFNTIKKPEIPQHEKCHCTCHSILKPIANVNAKAECDLRKFTEYIFADKYAWNGKRDLFHLLGFNVEDSQYLKQEYEKQAVEEYCNSNYKLGKLNDQGQRINIDIKFEKNNRKIIFESGWMVRPKGLITNNTPLAD